MPLIKPGSQVLMIWIISDLHFRGTISVQMYYFNYLEKNGITFWSVESSEAFAKIASGETARSEADPLYTTAGPWDYGDQHYPEHVLRYYHI